MFHDLIHEQFFADVHGTRRTIGSLAVVWEDDINAYMLEAFADPNTTQIMAATMDYDKVLEMMEALDLRAGLFQSMVDAVNEAMTDWCMRNRDANSDEIHTWAYNMFIHLLQVIQGSSFAHNMGLDIIEADAMERTLVLGKHGEW